MNKKNIIIIIVSAVIMVLLPLLVVKVVSSDAGMAVCFLLFFAVNPIYSAVVGALAGANGKMNWLQVFITPILFWLGTAIAFDIGERAFIVYAIVYAVIILVAMFVSYLINKKKVKN